MSAATDKLPIMVSPDRLAALEVRMAEISGKIDAALALQAAVDSLASRVRDLELDNARNTNTWALHDKFVGYAIATLLAILGSGVWYYALFVPNQ